MRSIVVRSRSAYTRWETTLASPARREKPIEAVRVFALFFFRGENGYYRAVAHGRGAKNLKNGKRTEKFEKFEKFEKKEKIRKI